MIGKDLARAIALLQAEEVVAIPTETVYGLAGNAFSPKAVSTIFAVKNRPSFDPLIVHTNEFGRAAAFTAEIPELAYELAERFMPGPLTILLPKAAVIPDIVTAGLPAVAVRVPRHPLAQELLRRLDFPLAAPSANPFGYISPTAAEHVEQQLGGLIPYILDGGPCQVGLESTIIGFENGQAVVYRQGGLAVEELEKAIGPLVLRPHSTSNPAAPGMLKSHYAPRVPLVLGSLEALRERYEGKVIGVIAFRQGLPGIPSARQLVLSPSGDPGEAARNLFAGMRRLDSLPLDLIIAELVPETGLGRAINDRLKRAAAAE